MNEQAFYFFYNLANKYWLLNWFFIFFAQYLPYLLAIVFVGFIFWGYKKGKDRLYYILLTAFSLLMARGLFVEFIRFFYPNPRPFKALGLEPLIEPIITSSFPSGHATVFFALTTLVYFINKKYFWHFAGAAVLVSLGRIIVGVHWPLDILGGAVLGIVIVLIARRLLPYSFGEGYNKKIWNS
jgi:undecaprenyl-diphosphatase